MYEGSPIPRPSDEACPLTSSPVCAELAALVSSGATRPRNVYIFGASNGGLQVKALLDEVRGLTIVAFVDSFKKGRFAELEIIDVATLRARFGLGDAVVLATQWWRDAQETLAQNGIHETYNGFDATKDSNKSVLDEAAVHCPFLDPEEVRKAFSNLSEVDFLQHPL